MQPTAFLDELMANAWPPEETVVLDRWRLRWASGVTRRANSVLPVGPDVDFATPVEAAEAFYRRRHARPMFQISTASTPPSLPHYLAGRGYAVGGRTLVMQATTRQVLAATDAGPWTFDVTARPRRGSISTGRWSRADIEAATTPGSAARSCWLRRRPRCT